MTDDLTKTACRVKWPSGRETICRSKVLVDAAASAKRVLDVLGGRVLAVIDLRFKPDGYLPRGVDSRKRVVGTTLPTREIETHKRLPVPKQTDDWLQRAQTDLF